MEFQIDTLPLKNYELIHTGFLRFVAPIAKVGKMLYRDNNGKSYYQYVTKELLIDSADSFLTQVVTEEHPRDDLGVPIAIDSTNAPTYQRGLTGNQTRFDGKFLWLNGTVTDAGLIQSIIGKERNKISPGYFRQLKEIDGKIFQEKRVGNHLAFVKFARGGEGIELEIDSDEFLDLQLQIDSIELPTDFFNADSVTLPVNISTETQTKEQKRVKTLKIGNTEFQVDEAVFDAVNPILESVTVLESENRTLKNEKASLSGRLAVLESKPAPQIDADGVNTQIKDRLTLWDSVTPAIQQTNKNFKPDYALNPIEIMATWIKHKLPNLQVAIDSMDLETESGTAFIKGAYLSDPPPKVQATKPVDSVFNLLNNGYGHGAETPQTDSNEFQFDSITPEILAELQGLAYGSEQSSARQKMIDSQSK